MLLPIIPAFILFKFLPESSKAEATGPYQKLKIKLGGAFAGYFILTLLLSGLLSRYFLVVPESDYEFWTVEGHVDLDAIELKPEMFIIKPPRAVSDGNTFFIRSVPIDRTQPEVPPVITLQFPDAIPLHIWLKEESEHKQTYTVRRDEKRRTFVVSVDSLSIVESIIEGDYPEDDGVEAVPLPLGVEVVAPDSLEDSGTSS